ncbi:MAG: NnrS family protein [Proteobacteria bacterium]|nr:NnrS family protein [Pseudomonadota bacterium]MBI3497675.1 NnrS family protein [Pseudomonadota bacterium]
MASRFVCPVTGIDVGQMSDEISRMAVFSAGFRSFFLLAPLYAVAAMAVWVPLWQGHVAMALPVPSPYWHGHEMLFGYATAVLAGFLLTAVPNWTGAAPVAGGRLALLVAVWVAARGSAWVPELVPVSIAATLDLAFLPLLGLLVAPAILRSNARRNGVFLIALALMTLVDLRYQLVALGSDWGDAAWSLRIGLGLFTLLIAVVGGRIVPSFTANWLKSQAEDKLVRDESWRDRAAVAVLLALVLAEAASAPDIVVGGLAAGAALLHAWRMIGWRSLETLRQPILWALHLGYAWLVAGLGLKAAALLGGLIPETAAIHALTAGTIGTMTVAVMSRAALGHSGRPVVASRTTVAAYGLVTLAAVLRVAAGALIGPYDGALIGAAGIAWILGFAAFLFAYSPLLLMRGRP